MPLYPSLQNATVSTLTVLFPFTNLRAVSPPLSAAGYVLAIINLDPTNSIIVNFETSEDGVHADENSTYTYTVGPGSQAKLGLAEPFPETYFAITANSQGPSYPTVAVQWCVRFVPVAS
jgi:hypothetical protein